MPSVTTEGLILKRVNFGEADRVLTVLTDRFGKISVIARGVRKITSRRAGNIELLNRVKLHLFKAKSYTLNEAESLQTFKTLKENLTLTTTAFHILELIDRLIPEGQRNPNLYHLVVAVLQILEKNPRQIFLRAFEVKLLSLLGFATFQPSTPKVAAQSTSEVAARINKLLLQRLEISTWEEIGRLDINKEQAIELEKILRYYLEKVLEAPLKSVKVLRKIR